MCGRFQEVKRNPPETPTTATINPMVTKRITRMAIGLLIDVMRTAYAIRFYIAAEKKRVLNPGHPTPWG